MKKIFLVCLYLIIVFKPITLGASVTRILEHKVLSCGAFDFGYLNKDDIDLSHCEIMAVALFNDERAINVKFLKKDYRFKALFDGDVDFIHASKTLKRELDKKYFLSNVHIYDSMVFIGLNEAEIKSPLDVKKGSRVCIIDDNMSEKYLSETMLRFMAHKDFNVVILDNLHEMRAGLLDNRCELGYLRYTLFFNFLNDKFFSPLLKVFEGYTSSVPRVLISLPEKRDLVIMSDIIFNSMLRSEEIGITKENIDDVIKVTNDKEILFMFGEIKGIGKGLSIDDKFVYRVIKRYGNYDQFFHNVYGKYSPYKIKRKVNNLKKNGGKFSPVRFVPLDNK